MFCVDWREIKNLLKFIFHENRLLWPVGLAHLASVLFFISKTVEKKTQAMALHSMIWCTDSFIQVNDLRQCPSCICLNYNEPSHCNGFFTLVRSFVRSVGRSFAFSHLMCYFIFHLDPVCIRWLQQMAFFMLLDFHFCVWALFSFFCLCLCFSLVCWTRMCSTATDSVSPGYDPLTCEWMCVRL